MLWFKGTEKHKGTVISTPLTYSEATIKNEKCVHFQSYSFKMDSKNFLSKINRWTENGNLNGMVIIKRFRLTWVWCTNTNSK